MPRNVPDSPMRIRLSEERRERLLASLRRHFADNFDEPLSDFRAAGLLDFFVGELGPQVYNQGVHDACAPPHPPYRGCSPVPRVLFQKIGR